MSIRNVYHKASIKGLQAMALTAVAQLRRRCISYLADSCDKSQLTPLTYQTQAEHWVYHKSITFYCPMVNFAVFVSYGMVPCWGRLCKKSPNKHEIAAQNVETRNYTYSLKRNK